MPTSSRFTRAYQIHQLAQVLPLKLVDTISQLAPLVIGHLNRDSVHLHRAYHLSGAPRPTRSGWVCSTAWHGPAIRWLEWEIGPIDTVKYQCQLGLGQIDTVKYQCRHPDSSAHLHIVAGIRGPLGSFMLQSLPWCTMNCGAQAETPQHLSPSAVELHLQICSHLREEKL